MQADEARLQSFVQLLQPGQGVCELYSLRHLCLQPGGIPRDSRAQAWRVLLGLLPPTKCDWTSTLAKRRDDYAHFVLTITTQTPSRRQRDDLLDQVYRDVSRSRRNSLSFYSQAHPTFNLPSSRHALLHRLALINVDYAESLAGEAAAAATATATASPTPRTPTQRQLSMPPDPQSPPIFLQPPSPSVVQPTGLTTLDVEPATPPPPPLSLRPDDASPPPPPPNEKPVRHTPLDRRWHSLLRILYIFAILNPSTGYVQGMGEIAFVLLYVLASDQQMVDSVYAEADAFWLFSNLTAQMRELYDFSGLQSGLQIRNRHESVVVPKRGGMAKALLSLSLRLKWLDEELWNELSANDLDPRNPYYSFRWVACLLSTELELPSVVLIWDALLAESAGSNVTNANDVNPRLDFVIDVCCALLTSLRGRLLEALQGSNNEDSFSRCMRIVQNFANEDANIIIEVAGMFRQRRLAAPLTGDGPALLEDNTVSVEKSARQRAEKVLRGWSGSAKSAGWFTPRRSAASLSSETSGPLDDSASDAPSRGAFARYAEAFQSSDTAASLSKASTNGLARAMATWNASSPNSSRKGAPDEVDASSSSPAEGQRRMPSLAGLFTRQRSDTDDSNFPSLRGAASLHPALRWSRDMPNLPLPNMSDDSPGREEYAWASRPHSVSVSLGRATGSPYSADSPNGSPSLNASANGRFPNLPSLRASPNNAVPARGPKPLLLASATQSPRSGAMAFGKSVAKSRKVSSGPMAASPRSTNGRHVNRIIRRESSTTTTSYAESCSSGGDAEGSRRGSSTVDNDETDVAESPRSSRRESLQTWQSAAKRSKANLASYSVLASV